MQYSNISSLRVVGNELAADVDGCVIAALSNVTFHAVQSWGRSCASGVVIPTPPTKNAAVEVTVWGAVCFAKALISGDSVHAIAGDVTNVIGMRQPGNIMLQCNGTALSFNAVPV